MNGIRLRHLVSVAPRLSMKPEPGTPVTFAPMEAISDGVGGLDISRERPIEEVASGSYNYFGNGDILLAKVTPCFENGKKALASDLKNGIGFATSEVHVLRPKPGCVHPRYLVYLLSSEHFKAAGISSMTGSGGLRRVSDEAILNYRPQVTNLHTQKSVADFLDRETARIDALVVKKRQLVLAMEEKKEAFAAEVSTRGLDSAAQMQPTGIEIVAEAPAHWEVMRVARVFREVAEKGVEGLPVLSVSINWGISDNELADEDRQRIVNQIADKAAYKRIRPNDLVYNMMRAWQGGFGVSRVEGLVSPAYVVARPHREIHAAYYEHLLRTPMWIEEFRRASKGIADFRQRLYWEHFRLVSILVPPLHEQEQIASAIAANNARLDRVAEKVSESIERLTELRASLITAAVTGQIDPATYQRNGATDRALDQIAEEMSQ